jgi:hypothetical protein
MEHVPQLSTEWTGDVWKVAFELNDTRGTRFSIADADNGVGILFNESHRVDYRRISELSSRRFDYFVNNFQLLPVVLPNDALKFIADCAISPMPVTAS